MKVYLDYASTCPVDSKVLESMLPFFSELYGNSVSIHQKGKEALIEVQKARQVIAQRLGVRSHELIFSSGATESNNLALKGLAFQHWKKKGHVIVSSFEHKSVLEAARWLEKEGFSVTYLKVSKEGFVSVEDLKKAFRDDTILVSIMHGQNEIGTIQDIASFGKLCRERKILFHTDACQSFLKSKIPLEYLDLCSINAHKVYGPKGIGALYVRQGVKLNPLLHGGGHELNMRGGTLNVPAIVGFGKAVEVYKEEINATLHFLKEYFASVLKKEFPDIFITSPLNEKGLVHILHVCFENIDGNALLAYLNIKGVFASSASACTSSVQDLSHVLKAVGLKYSLAQGGIRFSLGKETTQEEIDYVIEVLKEGIEKIGKR